MQCRFMQKWGRGVEKIGEQIFCVFGSQEVLKKEKIENEYEIPTEAGFNDMSTCTEKAKEWREGKGEMGR